MGRTLAVRLESDLLAGMARTKIFLHAHLTAQGMELEGPAIPTDSDFVRIAIRELITTLAANAHLHPQQTLFPEPPPKPAPAPAKKPNSRTTRAVPWPIDFVLTPARREYAMEHLGCTAEEAGDLWQTFAAHHGAKGNLFVEWPKAWITWVLTEKRYRGRQQRFSPSRPAPQSFEERIAKARANLNRNR